MSDRDVSGPKPRILLVEDERTLREHLAQALSDEYVVDTAANGREALRSVLKAFPELIVTDIVMPEVDGIELLRALRSTRRTKTIPVLLISGRAIDEQRIAGFKEGADGFLAKPYTEQELRACIGSMLRGTRGRSEAAGREAREQALADRAELLESITDAFYALDSAFRFTYVNQRALDYFGETGDQLLGQVFWDVFPAMRDTIFQKEHQRVVREECSATFEAVSPLNGRWVEVRAYPTRQGLGVCFRDVTERKRSEEQLRDADRRKSDFLAVLAHELRNPLGALTSGLQILRRSCPADPTILPTLSMLDRQMAHVARLVDDLLDMSRITSGKLELRRQRVLLTDVVGRAVECTRNLLEARHHELILNVRADDLFIDGDPDRLTQVFSNLLSNGAKYTDPGGRITLTLERVKGEAVVTVQDNGIGIPRDGIDRIFDMFSQGRRRETATVRVDGLGIGLSVVRRLVRMHKGSVRASSDGPGAGSRFTVRLPLAERAAAAPDPAASPLGRHPGQRVLVVDDNADAAASLAQLLEMEHYDVRTSGDGEEALEQARAFRPQIVFMDLVMPRLDGVEAARRLRHLPEGEHVRIVAVSGSGLEPERLRTQDAGMNHYLIKPVSLDALNAVLEALD